VVNGREEIGVSRPLRIEYSEAFYHATVTDIYGKVISFGYDKNSNLTALTYPDGKIVNYDYDYSGQLTQVKDWLNNVTAYTYDWLGSLVKTTYPNGSTVNYRYDDGYRLKSIVDSKSDGSLISVYKYILDQLGNRTGISSSQPLNVKPTPPNTAYTHDVDNRLLTAGDASFGYDDNGNLATKTLGTNVTNYLWDFNDMLTQVTKDGNTYTYKYDALGNRVARIENGVETRYVGSLAETDASGTITAYYVYGYGLISKITPSNESYFYHFDGIGSTVAITDSSGAIVNKYSYDEHGKVLNQEEAIPNPFKYVGRFGVMDEGNGLLYMRARYYDPEVGSFISKDPIGFGGGLNLYAYVANNPIRFTDPLGLEYLDLNFSFGFPFFIGFTGGVMWTKEEISPYIGGGIVSPGWGGSLTWSPNNISPGVSVALQLAAIVAGQGGYSFGKGCTPGSWFWEIGMGGSLPTIAGGSLTGYYVFGPYSFKAIDKALGLKPSHR